mgnify:CR=1 FL=1
MSSKRWHVYVLRNANNTKIYTGATNDPARRLKAHRGGTRAGGAKTTARWGKGDDKYMCMLISGFSSQREALRFERTFKRKKVRGLSGVRGRMAALNLMCKHVDVHHLTLWCELDAAAYFPSLKEKDKERARNAFLAQCSSHLFNCGVDIVAMCVCE